MPLRTILLALALALPALAAPAAAACEIVSPAVWPDTNYVTVCALDSRVDYDDGTQRSTTDSLLHASQASEADPAFVYTHAHADQTEYVYDDGTSRFERRGTTLHSGGFAGARGLAGGGFHGGLHQREQTIPEEGDSACSYIVGESTCASGGAWLTVQDVAGVGVGAYYVQSGSGAECTESSTVYVTAAVTTVGVPGPAGPCSAEAPDLWDEARFGELVP